eukprot:7934912-Lingulodinium_polyedra.AAC.1
MFWAPTWRRDRHALNTGDAGNPAGIQHARSNRTRVTVETERAIHKTTPNRINRTRSLYGPM